MNNKNGELPGFEKFQDEELNKLQLIYEAKRDTRIEKSKELLADEKEAKENLVAKAITLELMPIFKPGKDEAIVYQQEDENGQVHELYWTDAKLKSRRLPNPADGEG